MSTDNLDRREFLKATAGALVVAPLLASTPPPNVVLIYADDLGYGDLGCYGSKIRTPNLDRMAAQGMRFTQFYSANPVCSPSRAALLTGRYPTRVGVPKVLFPEDTGGLAESEMTIAQLLKGKGYRTMCIGKWHLGRPARYMPTSRGFDEYFGIPYSNDMNPRPLIHDLDVIEEPATLETLTPRYTEQAVRFIARSRRNPFFLYMPHTYPHIPLAASERFRGKSGAGPYGDAVEEIDWSAGQILGALNSHGLDRNTLVIFSSDNGPWYQGSPGRLRGRKGSTYEGGVREPFLARFPGRISPGTVSRAVTSTMDILPTLAGLCGASRPEKPLDGIDIWPVLTGKTPTLEREALLYFDDWNVQCARWGRWEYVPFRRRTRCDLSETSD
jgi:arylsulfatase A-like enzyme